MGRSSDCPLDEEFVSPPALTWSAGSDDEPDEEGEQLPVTHAPVALTKPVARDALRFPGLFGHHGDIDATPTWTKAAINRIFDLLPLVSDQRAFTFADQSTRYLLTPKLYHTVTIDLSRYPRNLGSITQLFNAKSVGRGFIKRVIFDDSNIVDKTRPPAGYTFLASLAIENLPLYQLEHFDWPADLQLEPAYTLRLLDRQDELKNVQLFNDSLALRAKDRTATVNSLHQLESLRISPDNPAGIRYLTYLIRQYPLKELHVDLRTYKPNQNELDYNVEANRDLDVVQILFDHARPLKGCPFHYQLPLTKLKLWNVNLYLGAETWTKVIRAMSLKEVELSRCAWTGNFLLGLGKMQPGLEKVKIHYDFMLDDLEKAPANTRAEEMGNATMNEFPASLSTFLQTLAGESLGDGDKSPASPRKHSLRWLEIKVEPQQRYGWVNNDRIKLLAPGLQVLALDFVPEDRNNVPWCDETTAATESCNPSILRQLCLPAWMIAQHCPDFTSINPVTFMLTDWGHVSWIKPEPSGLTLATKTLHKLLDVHKEHTRLRVVAVKRAWLRETMRWEDSETRQLLQNVEYFVRCEATVMGRKQDLMTPVTYAELKKYEKEIDILEPTPMVIGKYGRA